MIEIKPDIYQLQIPIHNNPLGHTNIYLIRDNDGYLLIDAGWDSEEALQAMKDQLFEIGTDLDHITRIIVTHVHGDHYGLVHTLKNHIDAEIIIHRREKEVLMYRYTTVYETLSDIEESWARNGAPQNETPMPGLPARDTQRLQTPVIPDCTVEGGEILTAGDYNLQVIWTPGHAPGHICLYEKAGKILFGGDHVLPVITPNISLLPYAGDNPLGEFMESLRRLDELDVELVLPAHESVYKDLHKRIEEITHHHHQRNMEIKETLKEGPKTAYQISSVITWIPESGGIRYKDLPPMHKRMAVLETLAHLKAMLVDDEVKSFTDDDIDYYEIS
ncbi:MAG: MBL fold metallo-hydrolase [Dehalococcoidales bacterium]|nr:MAG: MBL fold metallo-hydrolase [Dehalococcoidales bacterium]